MTDELKAGPRITCIACGVVTNSILSPFCIECKRIYAELTNATHTTGGDGDE